jgi:hypothetical protein
MNTEYTRSDTKLYCCTALTYMQHIVPSHKYVLYYSAATARNIYPKTITTASLRGGSDYSLPSIIFLREALHLASTHMSKSEFEF